ncbi:MAG: carboxypeptidase-like regulatory domain-containing protein, partial [Gemmatimonadota bacterium]
MKKGVAATLAMGLLLCARGAGAQQVVGRAVEADGATAIEGAFISLIDGAGTEITSTLSSDDGAYSLRAPEAGRYRLRVERIGFQTWVSEPFDALSGETVSRELRVSVRPVDLGELTVAVEGRCAHSDDAGHQLLRVWEEARKALQVTRWAEVTQSIR